MMYSYDYVIVGAGASGCVVAGRLAQRLPGAQIALVEAGPGGASVLTTVPAATAIHLVVPTQRAYRYRSVPQHGLHGRHCALPCGRGVGGGSAINAMVYIRGHANDYDDWRALGCEGWGWDDVLPYFLASENNVRGGGRWHGTGGPLDVADVREPHALDAAFIEAATQTGAVFNPDFNGAYQDGAGFYQVTQRNGRRCSAAQAFLSEPAPANLTVMTHSTALRVIFDGKRAAAVRVVRANGYEQTLRARVEIILTAGAVRTPQLLMCSGIGAEAELAEIGVRPVCNAPEVGRNLQDHPDYLRCFRVRGVDTLGISASGAMGLGPSIFRYFRGRRGVLTTNGAQSGAFLRTDTRSARPDVQLHFVTALLDNHRRKIMYGHGYACHVCVLRPKSRGVITLRDRDMRTLPLIDPRTFDHPDDLETMLRGVRAMNRILAAPALARFRPKAVHPVTGDTNEAWIDDIRHRTGSAYHPVGTCRMGSDANAVVDLRLRVVGVSGLRVADASIMPRLIGGNTQAAVIMIAERAAEWVVKDAPYPIRCRRAA